MYYIFKKFSRYGSYKKTQIKLLEMKPVIYEMKNTMDKINRLDVIHSN